MSISMLSISGIDICIGDYTDLDAEFSAQQLADINTITTEKRRRERALIYLLLNRIALGNRRYSHCAGATLGHNSDGSPYLQPLYRGTPAAISISHCRSGACIALCDHDVKFGIDIEDQSPKLARVKEKFLSEEELTKLVGTRYIASAPTMPSHNGTIPTPDADAIYRVPTAVDTAVDTTAVDTAVDTGAIGSDLLVAWTIKEAIYKAAGIEGLPLRDGITITGATEATAAGITYRIHSILSPTRCITLAISD